MKTLIGILLDRSGSMGGHESDVVGGINKFIVEQKKLKGKCFLGMSRFDTEYDEFRPALALTEIAPLEAHEYVPRGDTALLDAVAKTIGSLDEAKRQQKAKKVIMVIFTDGEENASREVNADQVKQLIKEREKDGWSFLYFGANIDRFNQRTYDARMAAHSFGIGSTGATGATGGVAQMYVQASMTVAQMRNTGSAEL